MKDNDPPEGAVQPPAKYAVHKQLGWLIEVSVQGIASWNTDAYWFFDNYWHAWGLAIRNAKTGCTFMMVDHYQVPVTGATVSAVYSVNYKAYKPCANPVYEIGNGMYGIHLHYSEVKPGDYVSLKCSAPRAETTVIYFQAQQWRIQ
jgi:hypothetical protein